MKVLEFNPECCIVHNGGSDRAVSAGGAIALVAVILPIAYAVSPFLQDHLANVPWLSALLLCIAAFVYFFLRGEANTVTLSREAGNLMWENWQLYFWKTRYSSPLDDVRSANGDTGGSRKQLAIMLQSGPVLFVGRATRAPGRVEAAKAIQLWLDEYQRDGLQAQRGRDRESGVRRRSAPGGSGV